MGEKARCVVALLPIAQTRCPPCFLTCPARSQFLSSQCDAERGGIWVGADGVRANLGRGEEGGDVQAQQKGRRIADFGL